MLTKPAFIWLEIQNSTIDKHLLLLSVLKTVVLSMFVETVVLFFFQDFF